MASWVNKPKLAPEFPLLKVDNKTRVTGWKGSNKDGVIYFRSEKAMEVVIGHSGNSTLSLEVNDVPLLVSRGSVHTKESQNSAEIQKGLNKLRFYSNGGQTNVYIASKSGDLPEGITYLKDKEIAQASKLFAELQEKQWKSFAENTYRKVCANCHSIDGNKAVGPPLNGMFGKTQVVLDKQKKKSTVTIDEAYLREAIIDPYKNYPEGYQPLMPKLQLNTKEIDTMVRWLKELK